MKLKRLIISASFTVVLLAGFLLFYFQSKLVFHPTKLAQNYEYHFSEPFQQEWVDFEGAKLQAVYFPAPKSKITILYLHGNAGSMATWGNTAAELRDVFHLNVWMLDFPGFGKSGGSLTTQEQFLAVTDAYYAFAHKSYPEQKFIFWGRSIGTGVAAYLSTKVAPLGLVLESPYQNFSRIASEAAPWFPTFMRAFDLPTDVWLKTASFPVLIVHGKKDTVISYDHTAALHKMYPQFTILTLDEAGHGDLREFDEYWAGLKKFLAKISSANNAVR